MGKSYRPILLFCSLFSLFLSSSAQTCSYSFSNNRVYDSCNTLPRLNAYLHHTYHASNGTVDIAYRAAASSSSDWVAWAINPSELKMVGSQALVAYQNSSGIQAYTAPITTFAIQRGNLSFPVSGLSAEYVGSEFIIYATLTLTNNGTTVNQVWQQGTLSNGVPQTHPFSGANVQSTGTLDFLSGVGTSGGSNSRIRRRNVHGVLNAVSWGVLMPLGAIIARYMRVFKSADPAWFYLHVACQTSAYIVGVAGWGTGLKLGSDSVGIKYSAHRNIGIALFCLATVQVFALLLRPKKDHKYRLFWNIYHHAMGYAVIILSIVNIYKGFDILDPEKKWKRTYTGIIIALGAIAVILEAITWPIVLKRKWKNPEKSHHGASGHGVRDGV